MWAPQPPALRKGRPPTVPECLLWVMILPFPQTLGPKGRQLCPQLSQVRRGCGESLRTPHLPLPWPLSDHLQHLSPAGRDKRTIGLELRAQCQGPEFWTFMVREALGPSDPELSAAPQRRRLSADSLTGFVWPCLHTYRERVLTPSLPGCCIPPRESSLGDVLHHTKP